jgi:hypothetical protein
MQPPATTVTSNGDGRLDRYAAWSFPTSNSCLLYVLFYAENEDSELVLGLVAATLAIGTAIPDTDPYSEYMSASTRAFKGHAQGHFLRDVTPCRRAFPDVSTKRGTSVFKGWGSIPLKASILEDESTKFLRNAGKHTATRRHNPQDMNPQHTKILRITHAVSPQYCCDNTRSIAVVTRKKPFFWNVTRYGLVEVYRRYRGFCCSTRGAVARSHITELSRKRATPASFFVVSMFTALKYALIWWYW